MHIKIFAVTLIATSALAAPAFAQDADPNFTGPRVEALVGWDHAKDRTTKADGVTYGGAIGYDFQVGNAVFGIEGEAMDSSTRHAAQNVRVAGDRYSIDAGRDLYLGARVGFTVGNRALVYAKGGYTNARLSANYTTPTTNFSAFDDYSGWRVGTGSEVKLGGKLYAKGEYRYSRYDDNSGIHVDRHQVVAGLGVRF